MSFTDSDDPDVYKSFVIPIMVGPFKSIKPLEREEVIARCQFLTVMSGTYKDIRWYKTESFLTFIGIVIIIVVTIFTWGSGTAPAAALVAAGTAAAMTYAMQMLILAIIQYAKTRLIGLILEKLLTALGAGEWAALVATIAVAAMSYGAGADLSTITLDLVKATSEYAKVRTDSEMKGLNLEMGSLSSELDKVNKEHEEAMKSMEVKNVLGLSMLNTYKAESPELFFSRAEFDTTELLASFDAFMGLELNIDYMTS